MMLFQPKRECRPDVTRSGRECRNLDGAKVTFRVFDRDEIAAAIPDTVGDGDAPGRHPRKL